MHDTLFVITHFYPVSMKTLVISEPFPLLSNAICQKVAQKNPFEKILSKRLSESFTVQPDTFYIVDQDDPGLPTLLESIRASRGSSLLITLTRLSPKIIYGFMGFPVAGLIQKTASDQEWNKAIQTILSGNKYLPNQVMNTLQEFWMGNHPGDSDNNPPITDRETEVLTLIVAGHTTREIAHKLCLCTSTIETHRLNLMHKLCVKNAAGLVREAFLQDLLPAYQGNHGYENHAFH